MTTERMRKLYKYSESDFKFYEIKGYAAKYAAYTSICILIIGAFFVYYYQDIKSFYNSEAVKKVLEYEERKMNAQIERHKGLIDILTSRLDTLANSNNTLRIAANLSPISEDIMALGTGGGSFDELYENSQFPGVKLVEDLNLYLENVKKRLRFEQINTREIRDTLYLTKRLFDCIPALKPALGGISYRGFGVFMHPIYHVPRMHDGIDISGGTGDPVFAAGDGTVNRAEYNNGYGLVIYLNHGFGYTTVYAHLSATYVQPGDHVKRGDVIGAIGNTGLSTTPHLHYEVHHNGVKYNPRDFILSDIKESDIVFTYD